MSSSDSDERVGAVEMFHSSSSSVFSGQGKVEEEEAWRVGDYPLDEAEGLPQTLYGSDFPVVDVLLRVLLFVEADKATLLALSSTCRAFRFYVDYLPHWDVAFGEILRDECKKELLQNYFGTRHLCRKSATKLSNNNFVAQLKHKARLGALFGTYLVLRDANVWRITAFFLGLAYLIVVAMFLLGLAMSNLLAVIIYTFSFFIMFMYATGFVLVVWTPQGKYLWKKCDALTEKFETIIILCVGTAFHILYGGSVAMAVGQGIVECRSFRPHHSHTLWWLWFACTCFSAMLGGLSATSLRQVILLLAVYSPFILVNPAGWFVYIVLLDYVSQCS